MSRQLSETQQREIAGRAQFLAEQIESCETAEDHTGTAAASTNPSEDQSITSA